MAQQRPVHGIELEDFIKELSRHLGKDYKKLARALGMVRTDIDSIEYREPRELKEQIYLFFDTWKQTQGKNASISQLMSGLKKAELLWCLEQMDRFMKGSCKEIYHEDAYESDTVMTHTVQPSEPVGIDQPSDHRPKAHSLDVSTAKIFHGRSNSEGSRYRIEKPRACGTSRSPSVSSHSSTDIDDREPMQLVFETTGAILIDIQALQQQANVSITRNANKFEVCGGIQDCCRLLNILLARANRRSPRMTSKKIPIERQDQWGRIVGTKGSICKAVMKLSGAQVKIDSSEYTIVIRGYWGQVMAAETLIQRALKGEDIVTEATPESILACLKRDLKMYEGFKFEINQVSS